jgi:hypothetical protein
MPMYKTFLTRRNGAKLLDTYQTGERPHVGHTIRVGGVGAVVTSVNDTQFVDQERGPLDGVVYAAEGAADALPPSAEVAGPEVAGLEASESHPETRLPH